MAQRKNAGNDQRRDRILIVEDEQILALCLEDVLIEAGFEIAGVAAKLEKALALIESDACDAAIIDANLAGINARPVADALAIRHLPFIMLSGSSQQQMQRQFGGAVFLQKPCRPEVLVETLNTLLLNR